MGQPSSQADFLKVWQLRLRALEAKADELADLAPTHAKLQDIETRAQSAFLRQSAAAAAKQEASKEQTVLVAEGRLVMAFLNAGLRQHYGKDSEQLAGFSLMPFRGRGPAAAGTKGGRKKGTGEGDKPVTPPPAEPPASSPSETVL
ncbi:MAG: hypothetical protein ACJ759_21125 [Thermoanaerobaculia bacterium]